MDSLYPFSSEQLLSQIHSESLQKLLLSLRLESSVRQSLCIPCLDLYVAGAAPARLSSGLPKVIEIDGHSGSGKTHFLYFLVATCVLQSDYLSISVGGWNKAAIVIDMDGYFRVSQFREILSSRLQERQVPSSAVPSIVERCLYHLHIFRPTSSEQLAVTLKYLPQYHSRLFPDFELGIIAIHSADAQYWVDRFRAERIRSVPASEKYRHTGGKLQDIMLSYDAVLVISHSTLHKTTSKTQDYAADPEKHESTFAINPKFSPTIPDPMARCQLSLTCQSIKQCNTIGDSQIQVLARALGQDETVVFKFCLGRQIMKIES